MSMVDRLIKRVGSSINNMREINQVGEHWCNQLHEAGIIDKTTRLLDFGAGVGRMAKFTKQVCRSVNVYDECPDMQQFLMGQGLQPIQAIWQRGMRWDVALCTFVLQHNDFDRCRLILSALGSVCQQLIFTVPTVEQFARRGQTPPEGYVSCRDIEETDIGNKESVNGLWTLEDLKLAFDGTPWDFETLKPVPGLWDAFSIERSRLPNVFLWAPGHSATTIVIRMMKEFGWTVPSPLEEFQEPGPIVDFNQSLLAGEFEWEVAAELIHNVDLLTHGKPWVLKDPRFCEPSILENWAQVLEPYRFTMLYLVRNPDDIKDSYARRQNATRENALCRGRYVSETIADVERKYIDWPGPKLRLTLDQIAAAAKLFDPVRCGIEKDSRKI